jgi:hypothetical protein
VMINGALYKDSLKSSPFGRRCEIASNIGLYKRPKGGYGARYTGSREERPG